MFITSYFQFREKKGVSKKFLPYQVIKETFPNKDWDWGVRIWSLAYLYIVTEVVGHDSFDDVEADVGARVAHMTLVIDSWTACVPRNLVRVHCTEYFLIFYKVEMVKYNYVFFVYEGLTYFFFGEGIEYFKRSCCWTLH